MRLKPANSVLPIFIAGLCMSLPAISAIGQERTGVDMETPFNESKVSPEPPDTEFKPTTARTSNYSASLCDSTASQVKVVKPITTVKGLENTKNIESTKTSEPVKSAEKSPKTEDPLSFNFLYYIIEKFKMSDMIE